MSPDVMSDLVPTGVLRAGINLSNFLLVTGKSPAGNPEGVAPDLAREIATRLDVPLQYVPFKSPGELADAAASGVWDIGLIGAEPQRAETISFSPAPGRGANTTTCALQAERGAGEESPYAERQ